MIDTFGGRYECFACGNVIIPIHRCHIIPASSGGSNLNNNLHLLCRVCHIQSEGIALFGEEFYWKWLAQKRKDEWKEPYKWAMEDMERKGFNSERHVKYIEDHDLSFIDTMQYMEVQFKEFFKGNYEC